jgi:hypothetical protein
MFTTIGIILTLTGLIGAVIFTRDEIRHHDILRERNRAIREDINRQLANAKNHPTISRP